MYDLIYLANRDDYVRALSALREAFPNASFGDESNFIHEHRISITVECSDDEYRLRILELGFALCSLTFQLWKWDRPKQVRELVEAYIRHRKRDKKG